MIVANRNAWLELFVIAALAGAIPGCSADTSTGTVRGSVTLDDAPLERGVIGFVPIDGQTPTADAIITEGKFTAKVPIGDKRVTISAAKVVGKRKVYETADSPTIDTVEELLPARYNAETTLSMTVKAGAQEQDFPLDSDPRRPAK